MLRRIGVVASLAVVAAMFTGVSPAHAQTAGVCIFNGLSGQLQPAIPNSIPDASFDVERGTYNFSGNGTCAALLAGVPVIGTSPITSVGDYDNISCGTGFAHDLDGNGTSFPGLGVSPSNPAGYEIPFFFGTGPLLIGPAGKPPLARFTELLPPDAAAPTHPADGVGGGMHGLVLSNYVGHGVVQIVPGTAQPPNPPNENCIEPSPPDPDGDTDQFVVNGFFVGAR
jgi:hypothetical protein